MQSALMPASRHQPCWVLLISHSLHACMFCFSAVVPCCCCKVTSDLYVCLTAGMLFPAQDLGKECMVMQVLITDRVCSYKEKVVQLQLRKEPLATCLCRSLLHRTLYSPGVAPTYMSL